MVRRDRRHEPLPAGTTRRALVRFSIGSLVYLVAIATAFLSAPAALALIALVAAYYVFEQTPATDAP